jgi:hypothetical protein
MRALGIALMVFNLLLTAAIGLYLAPNAWSKRQEMNAHVAKHYLVKIGLPYEAPNFNNGSSSQPISFPTTGGHVVEYVSTDLLTGYFGGDSPVNSQKEELEKAYAKVQGEIAGMGGPAEVVNFLCGSYAQNRFTPGLLTLMAKTYEDRTAVRALIPTGKADANFLQASANKAKDLLKAQYDAVTAGKSEMDKKDRLAHFLAYLNPQSNTHQKRVILVVGLNQYAKTLGDQAASYDEIARRVNRRIEQDQDFYVQEYELLKKLAIERSQVRNVQKDVENDLQANKTDDDTAVKSRLDQKARRQQELDALRGENKGLLDANAALEAKLHATQKKVGDLLDAILAEEAKVDAAERTAGGSK